MAITATAHKALERYIRDCGRAGRALKESINGAVILTESQRDQLSAVLTEYWGRDYKCPAILDIKPHHGYTSRVIKDEYSPDDYVLWLVAGCSDVAEVETDEPGRPRLVVRDLTDDKGRKYDLVVIVSSDTHGFVHINDVIPKGLPPKRRT